MAQIKTGTASVTNGSNIVTASPGVDWSAATSMSFFSVDFVLGAPLYPINSRALVEITPGVFRWQLTLGIPYAEPDNEGLYYLIQKDFLTVAVGPQNFYLATFEVSDTQTLPLLNRNFAAIAAIVAALNLRPTGANSFTSYAALEAYDVGRLVLGDVVFVTIDDSTQIRQLQAGAPEGSDRSVLGTGTMRWRQTGGT